MISVASNLLYTLTIIVEILWIRERLFCHPDPEQSEGEGSRFFAEFILVSRSSERSEEEILRSLLSLRMTQSEGLRMTGRGC